MCNKERNWNSNKQKELPTKKSPCAHGFTDKFYFKKIKTNFHKFSKKKKKIQWRKEHFPIHSVKTILKTNQRYCNRRKIETNISCEYGCKSAQLGKLNPAIHKKNSTPLPIGILVTRMAKECLIFYFKYTLLPCILSCS